MANVKLPHMRRALVTLLLVVIVGVAGLAEQTWQMISSCPPKEPFTFCKVAEGIWSMVQFDEGWRRLALMSRRKIDIVDPYSGTMIVTVTPPSPWMEFTGIPTFSSDRPLVACAVTDGTVWTWDVEAGEETGAFPSWLLGTCAAFSHDGAFLVTQGTQGDATVWSMDTGDLLFSLSELKPYGNVCVLGFDYEDTFLFALGASGDGAYATGVWDVATRTLVRVFPGTAGPMPDGAVYTLEPRLAPDCALTRVAFWEGVRGTLARALLVPGPMLAAAFSRDGQYMVLGLRDGTVSIWDLNSESEIHRLDLREIISDREGEAFDEATALVVSISPDGSLLATGTWVTGPSRAYVHLWNVSALLVGGD
jgi:WD40 repeat protein